jgi:hypothetical protein
MTRALRAACLLALVSTLIGCATTGTTVKLLPPVDLLQDCPAPVYTITTNRDIALAIPAWKRALALCNNDKASLREWAKDK